MRCCPPLIAAGALALLAASPTPARSAGRSHRGARPRATCANCHGTSGMSRGAVPSLAGQPKADIAAKMQEFKQNKRPGTIMPQLAKGFTDEQIDVVAAWFASQPSK